MTQEGTRLLEDPERQVEVAKVGPVRAKRDPKITSELNVIRIQVL